MPLSQFHPAVAAWFTRAFTAPTAVQLLAWPAIQRREHTLIAAPTGSGKTLAAFQRHPEKSRTALSRHSR